MDILSSVIFFALGLALGWLVFAAFAVEPPRDDGRDQP